MRSGGIIRKTALALVVALAGATGVARAAPPADVAKRLIVSFYKSEAAAEVALGGVKLANDQHQLVLQARALVVKGADGKVKVRDRRADGTRAGQTVAAVGGVMGSRAGLGVGASGTSAAEYLTGVTVGMPKAAVDMLKVALQPGDAAVVSAVDDKGAPTAVRVQSQGAVRVVTYDFPTLVPELPEAREPERPITVPPVPVGSP